MFYILTIVLITASAAFFLALRIRKKAWSQKPAPAEGRAFSTQAVEKADTKSVSIKNVLSASLLISGTCIGAGMLGLPVITAQTGFWPAAAITFAVWAFMYLTALLFLEATLWMPPGSNILSMAGKLLGKKSKIFSGAVFLFLYYCLLVAYFAAGAPILSSLLANISGISFTGWGSFAFFGSIFGIVIILGLNFVDKLNYVLMLVLIAAYLVMIKIGGSLVDPDRFLFCKAGKMALAAPVLFGAFGFHNIIPPLVFQSNKNIKEMRLAIFWGSFIPLVIYLIWQWLIMGSLSMAEIEKAYTDGLAVTQIMGSLAKNTWFLKAAGAFGLCAIATSMLGVAYSVYDFINDGLKAKNTVFKRLLLCLLTFLPPFVMTSVNPHIFLTAIGIAGGFGEAFLNGCLPVWLVYKGRQLKDVQQQQQLKGGKKALFVLLALSFTVMLLEIFTLLKK